MYSIESIARKEGVSYQAVVRILLRLGFVIDSERVSDTQAAAIRKHQEAKEDWLLPE